MQSYKGVIIEGTKRASALGYPTINIPLKDTALSGIYAARVVIEGEEHIAAVFADPKRKVLEAYLIDFSARDLYGKEATVSIHKKIRDSMRFENDALLRQTIEEDVRRVREYFADEKSASIV